MVRYNWNGMKQALVLPRLEMERHLAIIGKQHASMVLATRLEEARVWQDFYNDHVMLSGSLATRCTWADILNGVVDLLPPRDIPDNPEYHRLAEVNRRYMEFKVRMSSSLLGHAAPRRPNYRDLYKQEAGRKHQNQRSYERLIAKHKQQQLDLARQQGTYAPQLASITEESKAKTVSQITTGEGIHEPILAEQGAQEGVVGGQGKEESIINGQRQSNDEKARKEGVWATQNGINNFGENAADISDKQSLKSDRKYLIRNGKNGMKTKDQANDNSNSRQLASSSKESVRKYSSDSSNDEKKTPNDQHDYTSTQKRRPKTVVLKHNGLSLA